MTRYAHMFEQLAARREGAFIPFTVLCDPEPETSRRIIDSLIGAGADALELGIPFSDPIADGPTIQTATVRALENGATPQTCWTLLRAVRAAHPDIPIGLLVYSNLVMNDGPAKFYATAAEVGVDSVVVADVPCMEAETFVAAARASGVDPVLIAPPNASEERLRAIARLSGGYTYVVTRSGVTGAERAASMENASVFELLRSFGAPPCIVGFGISTPDHVRNALRRGAAGAISGSAVVDRITSHLGGGMEAALDAFVREMKAATIPA